MRIQEFTSLKHALQQRSTLQMAISIPVILLALFYAGLLVLHFDRSGYLLGQRDWFIVLNSAASAWPGRLWSNVTLLGDATVLIPLMSPLIISRPQAFAAILGAVPAASAFSLIGKYTVSMPRPATVLDQVHIKNISHTVTGFDSFPSGHAITIFAALTAVLAILWLSPKSRHYWLLLMAGMLVAVTVSFSRIAVGAHWPLDVLAGVLCGLVAGASGAVIAQRRQEWWQIPLRSIGRYLLGSVLLLSGFSLIYRAFEYPSDAPVFWLSGLSGLVVSGWLLTGLVRRLGTGSYT